MNKMMHEAVSRDSVWMKVFKQDSKEDVQNVLQNEWLSKKWNLMNPGVATVEEAKPASEDSV